MNQLNKFINNGNQMNQGGNQNIISQFMQFAKGFQGNPEQKVMELLQSGQMTQEQFNQLSQQANQIMGVLNQLGIK